MPVHIEEMTSEVTVVDGELPLTEKQLERIAEFVIGRLEDRNREREQVTAATTLRTGSQPASGIEGG